MTQTLYLRLTELAADAPVEGLLVAADGIVVAEATTGALTEFAARCPGARVIALVPGSEALATTARLPKISAAKVRTSLPYALEEFLASDLDAQHFAIGRAAARAATSSGEAGLNVPVIVMLRTRLDSWVDLLRAQGLEPAAMHLEDSCVAAKPGDVVGWMRADELLLRSPSGDAVVGRSDDLAAALQLLPTDPPVATLGLQIHATADERARHGALIEHAATGFSRVSWLALPSSPLPWLVSQLAIAAPIDLLQGEFAPRKSVAIGVTRWRLAAALVAVMFLLHVGERMFVWQRDNTAAALLERTLFDAVKSVRPEVQSPNDAQALLGKRDSSGRALTTALADLAAAGAAADSLVLVAVEAGNVRIEFRSSLATDNIEKSLIAENWQVRKDAMIDGRVVLTLNRARSERAP